MKDVPFCEEEEEDEGKKIELAHLNLLFSARII